MIVRLSRYAYTPEGTFGVLSAPGLLIRTIERGWAGNKPNISCIPEGEYSLDPHHSPSKGDVMIVTGAGVYKTEAEMDDAGGGRWGILFHKANIAGQLHGCVAPGMKTGVVFGKWAVLQSGAAMGRLMSVLGGHSHSLTINFNHKAGL